MSSIHVGHLSAAGSFGEMRLFRTAIRKRVAPDWSFSG